MTIYRRSGSGELRTSDAQVVDAYRLLYKNGDPQNVELLDGDSVAVPVNKSPMEDSAAYVYGQVGKISYQTGQHLSGYRNSAGAPPA